MFSFWKLRQSPNFRFAMLTLPGALFLLIFLVLPLISILIFSFWRTESYQLIADWNIENYKTILGEKTYLTFMWRSLVMAVSVSLVCLIYAYPVAYLVAKHGGRYRLILVLLTAAPFFTGIILRVTAMQQILGPIGLLNMTLQTFGFEPIQILMYSNVASAIGLVYLWIPFMVLAIYLSLLNFNFELLEVAYVNGAKPWRAFMEITWPLNWIGTAIGIVLVFIPTFAAFVTPRFLGGVNGALYGNILEHQFGATGTWALGSAMGVVLFFICLIFIMIIWRTINLQRSGYTGEEF
ncbi:MAG: ABC transporter permease [Desulfobacterales bacterium]|jgi:ABC-type spermidine/putrescine transport system permease subunit I